MNAKPQIRPYDDVDLAAIVELEQQAFDLPQSEQQILPLLSDRQHCLIVELGGKIIGFAFARAVIDEAELLNIALKPTYQGSGIADLLLDRLFFTLKKNNISLVYLEVRESNHRAIQFYLRKGFEKTGIRPNYYTVNLQGKENAVLMRKDL